MMIPLSTSSFSHHNIFLHENGDIYAWGNNFYGQCGLSLIINRPTKILHQLQSIHIKSIVLGEHHSLILQKNGELFGFGRNNFGQLSQLIKKCTYTYTRLATNVKRVWTSSAYTFIEDKNKKIFYSGYLTEERRSDKFMEFQIDNINNIFCGGEHLFFLKKNGEVWAMGDNTSGQCGLDLKQRKINEPRLILVDKSIFSISAGDVNGKTILK
eukprot:TRINITY_DN9673_c0_g1_i1.p1 TRINITY_DN9673_c0_g1~~TRINITY_DN9673_c0_g1_i1.p1  ORF type:complete len:212 (-),score=54.34 TRINITY_DN9673_c0_g1_i1:262-897(-)